MRDPNASRFKSIGVFPVHLFADQAISLKLRGLLLVFAVAAVGCSGGTDEVITTFSLYDIESGTGGFPIHGILLEPSGNHVAASGDVNGDGIDDALIGVPDPLETDFPGMAYVVFGKTNASPVEIIDVESGVGGFAIVGDPASETAGDAIADAGDVNGDDLHDIVIGAVYAGPSYHGRVYIVHGKTDTTPIELADVLLGMGGFAVEEVGFMNVGSSVSGAGDFNDDGFDDVIIGDPAGNRGLLPDAGISHLVLGQSDTRNADSGEALRGAPAIIEIRGAESGDESGISVSRAGDINEDGFDDLIIGAPSADPFGRVDAGKSYVVFGRSGMTNIGLSSIDDGDGGFVIYGAIPFEYSGWSVSGAGDVNGDGISDLLVGARESEASGFSRGGAAYVVFGKMNTEPADLLYLESDMSGFAILAAGDLDFVGNSVSPAGDVNGDGLDDVVVGAPYAELDFESYAQGAAYVIYGKADSAPVDLADVQAGNGGFTLAGSAAQDTAGWSVSGGADFNHDGYPDILVGVPGAGPGIYPQAPGTTYVVFNPFAPEVD